MTAPGRPTLERLDRAFASVEWIEQFSCHHLRCLSSDCSDHAPLLLVLNSVPWARPRFRFDQHWMRIEGFIDVVKATWGGHLVDTDVCRCLDHKLRVLAKALRSWRASCVGNVRLQLAAACAVVYELDLGELELRRELKANIFGLASHERTMARQRTRTRNLREGDACTKYFHLQACHRRSKNYLFTLTHNGETFSEEDAKADIVFDYYNGLLGTAFTRQHRIDLSQLDLPRLNLDEQAAPFMADEVAWVIRDSPADRAPGPAPSLGGLGHRWSGHHPGVPSSAALV